MRRSDFKVFGIGLNKTGTTTLNKCGNLLGYRCTSYDKNLLKDVVLRKDFSTALKKANEYNFFEDWPWPLIYKELDREFPGSKFILTVRKNEFTWIESLKKHSLRTSPFNHGRKLVFGHSFPHRHEEKYVDFYRAHNEEVRKYFADRTEDFLEICWENGDGINKLCRFLDLDSTGLLTPHENRGLDRKSRRSFFLINRLFSYIGL